MMGVASAQSSFFNPDDPPTATQRDIMDNPILRENVEDFKGDIICLSLASCLNILDTHTPNSFDYDLLAADLDRFGTEAQSELLERFFEKNGPFRGKALAALARSARLLPPDAQRRMTSLWLNYPDEGDLSIDDFARLMTRHVSPMVRSAVIDSLQSPRADIRRASHDLLTRIGGLNMTMALRPGDIKKIAQALERNPHPSLASILKADKSVSAEAVLASGLKTSDAPTLGAFYQTLYDIDRERAFRALVATLYGLKLDGGNALALAEVLLQRHKNRPDGFYMSFASDLIQDEDMSPMGRMVGLDAVLRSAQVKSIQAAGIDLEAYRLGLKAHAGRGRIPMTYFDAVAVLGKKAPDNWLAALLDYVPQDDLEGQRRLLQVAGAFDTALAKDIARTAFKEQKDHRRFMAALFARTAQAKTPKQKSALMATARRIAETHPLSVVRQAADLSVRALKTKNPRGSLPTLKLTPLRAFNKGEKSCAVQGYDFAKTAQTMPYFEGGVLPSGTPVLRAWLKAGQRMPRSWLAGYSTPKGEGGLIAYDIETGRAENLMTAVSAIHQNIQAILPFGSPELGQNESSFWIIGGLGYDAGLYRAVHTGRKVDIRLALVLPAVPRGVTRGNKGEIVMAFGDNNPPLRFSDRDGLSRACDAPTSSPPGTGVILP